MALSTQLGRGDGKKEKVNRKDHNVILIRAVGVSWRCSSSFSHQVAHGLFSVLVLLERIRHLVECFGQFQPKDITSDNSAFFFLTRGQPIWYKQG